MFAIKPIAEKNTVGTNPYIASAEPIAFIPANAVMANDTTRDKTAESIRHDVAFLRRI